MLKLQLLVRVVEEEELDVCTRITEDDDSGSDRMWMKMMLLA